MQSLCARLPWLCLVCLIVFPLVAPALNLDFYVSFVRRVLIFALAATSLNFILGYGGMVALGHAAFFGAGAYVAAILSTQGLQQAWLGWPIAMLVSAALALIVGVVSLRTRGVYFIMITLAFAQMVFYAFFDNKALGGSDGVYINVRPGGLGLDLENKWVLYYFTLACMVLTYAFLRRLLWSPFGRTLNGIRLNEHRTSALGYASFSYKLTAFTVAGGLAGLAGYLWGAQTGYVNPELMGFHMSAHAIMMVILGGMGNVAGALIGAFGFELFMHVFKDLPKVGSFDLGKHWQLWMGSLIVLVVLIAPQGLMGLLRSRKQDD
jgi:branched-chain amino acid transport system permease protein